MGVALLCLWALCVAGTFPGEIKHRSTRKNVDWPTLRSIRVRYLVEFNSFLRSIVFWFEWVHIDFFAVFSFAHCLKTNVFLSYSHHGHRVAGVRQVDAQEQFFISFVSLETSDEGLLGSRRGHVG